MWLKPVEAAKYIGVCKETLLRYIHEGKIKAHYLGTRTIRIDPKDLDEFMRGI